MDWRQLIRQRWFQVAGGGTVALGAYVLYQRKKSTGSSASTPSTSGTVNTGAGLDTTGTDVAAWLGSQTGQFQDILNQFQQQLRDTLNGARQMSPGTGYPPRVITLPSSSGGPGTPVQVLPPMGLPGQYPPGVPHVM